MLLSSSLSSGQTSLAQSTVWKLARKFCNRGINCLNNTLGQITKIMF